MAGDEVAVSSFRQTNAGARLIHNRAGVGSCPRKGKDFRSVCPPRQGTKLRRLIPAAGGRAGCVVVQPFVREKGKEPITQDGAPSRAAPVVEAVGIAHVAVVIAIVFCECIQTWAMGFEKKAAMVLVRPILRNDLNLRAAIPAIFRVVVIGEDFDFLDGVLVRRNDGCAAPGNTGGSDAVDLVIVFAGSSATRPALVRRKCGGRFRSPAPDL